MLEPMWNKNFVAIAPSRLHQMEDDKLTPIWIKMLFPIRIGNMVRRAVTFLLLRAHDVFPGLLKRIIDLFDVHLAIHL